MTFFHFGCVSSWISSSSSLQIHGLNEDFSSWGNNEYSVSPWWSECVRFKNMLKLKKIQFVLWHSQMEGSLWQKFIFFAMEVFCLPPRHLSFPFLYCFTLIHFSVVIEVQANLCWIKSKLVHGEMYIFSKNDLLSHV